MLRLSMCAGLAALAILAAATALGQEKTIATVNGVAITELDVELSTRELAARMTDISPEERRRIVIEHLIDSQIMAVAARKDGLEKAKRYEALAQYSERANLRDTFIRQKLLAAITDAEVRTVYQEQARAVESEEEVRVRHVLLTTREEAQNARIKLLSGISFDKIAADESKDPATSGSGGDIGYFGKGKLLAEFEEAAFRLKVGEISTPVETSVGWHILRLEDRRKQTPVPYEQAKGAIVEILLTKKIADFIEQSKKDANINIVEGR
jgi:peptidyl-prolyl cis-trans isomerase C